MQPNQLANILRRIASKIDSSANPSRSLVLADLRRILASIGESVKMDKESASNGYESGLDRWNKAKEAMKSAFQANLKGKDSEPSLLEAAAATAECYSDIVTVNNYANFNAKKKQSKRSDKIGQAKEYHKIQALRAMQTCDALWSQVGNLLGSDKFEDLANATLKLCENMEIVDNYANWLIENPTKVGEK